MLMLLGYALAATPEVAVVGLHVDATNPTEADRAADALGEALSATGKVKALSPDTVGRRIAGTEPYILSAFALGGARDRMKEAQLLYDRAELDQVVPVLEDAVGRFTAGLGYTADNRELRDALVLQGMALLGMGSEDSAKEAFRRAVTLDPSAELDPVNHSPTVVEVYEAVRQDVRSQPPALLAVNASVPATVFVDGEEIGEAPQRDIRLPPGEHYLLVRSKDGGSSFSIFNAEPDEKIDRNVLVERRGLGDPATDASGRSRQTRDIYKALGEYSKGALLVLGGSTPTGVAIQLYSPTSGNFSRALTAEPGDDPVAALCDLAPALVAYIGENGDIRADKVSPQVVALDIGSNDTLARLIFEEKEPEKVYVARPEKAGVPWWVWAGGGAVVAGGGVALALVLATPEAPDPNQGTVTFGPVP